MRDAVSRVISLKKNRIAERAGFLEDTYIKEPSRYRVRNIPGAGALLKPEDKGEEQLSLPLESNIERHSELDSESPG